MGFRVDMSPLERSSMNIGRTLIDAGKSGADAIRDSQQYRNQQQEQGDIDAFMRQAMDGDPVALKSLAIKDPQAAQFVAEQIQKQQETQQIEQDRFKGEMALATADIVEKIHFSKSPEEQKAIFDAAVDDPRYDIDEEDRPFFMDDNARKALVGRVKGEDYANNFFGGGKGKQTAKQKDFDTYQRLKLKDPEAAKVFGAGAGFLTDDKKRLFKIENGIKYFADGTEALVGGGDKIKSLDMRRPMNQEQALTILDKAKESQSKNGGFAINMNRGLNDLNKLDNKGFEPKDISIIQTYLAGTPLGSVAMTPDEQVYAGAIESMINAIARRESGAAIGEDETKRFYQRYMPQAGDSNARIKQKRKALETQFKAIRAQSGRVYEAIRVTQGFDRETEKKEETPITDLSKLTLEELQELKAKG